VVHLHCATSDGVPRAGLVVSKAVGGSVVRHRVSRRLRHLLAPRLGELPAGAMVVVRALPPAADATSAELGDDLDSGIRAVLRKAGGTRRG
jgi:ribonuclease P protein component